MAYRTAISRKKLVKVGLERGRPAISQFKSAAHYSETKSRHAITYFVYTVEVPDLTDDNHIDFKKPVDPEKIKSRTG